MQSKVKITKRQIKEDKFTTFMLESRRQFLDNWQFYVIGIVVIILAVAGIAYYIDSLGQKKVEAGRSMAVAMQNYRTGDVETAINNLRSIVNNYGSEDVAVRAQFLLGKINLQGRRYGEAITEFQTFLNEYPDATLLDRAAALAGIAAAHEDQAEYAQAADFYGQARDEYPKGPQASEYLLGAIRTSLAAGQFDRAEELNDQLQADFAGTRQANLGARLYAEKTVEHPQT